MIGAIFFLGNNIKKPNPGSRPCNLGELFYLKNDLAANTFFEIIKGFLNLSQRKNLVHVDFKPTARDEFDETPEVLAVCFRSLTNGCHAVPFS